MPYRKISWQSSAGATLNFQDITQYILTAADGLGADYAETQTQKAPFQDGETLIDQVLKPRLITLEATILGDTATELHVNKRTLLTAFNPKLGEGLLIYELDPWTLYVDAVPQAAIFRGRGHQNSGATYQEAMISLLASDPWFKPVVANTVTFGDGANLGINNNGHGEAAFELLISGPATNPLITNNTTGEQIALSIVLSEGEQLYINTAFGKKEVTKIVGATKTNAFDALHPDSALFRLGLGVVQVQYDLEAGTGEMNLQWRQQFLGV